ncbi:short-chain dehydrogenase [Flavobacteriaceae bacterium CRH]|nr:short-chain dehydrogenase [Flavobacteriaceae bacterium CRH]
MIKTVLITGASAGIGRATAIYLAQKGYKVYGAARRVELMDDLKAYGVRPIALDVTDENSMSTCINKILNQEARIDILINSAGLGSYGALEDVPMSEAKNQLEINLFGASRLIQLVLPEMRKNKFGKIVNISSIGGKVGLPMGSWYHASKFAIEGLSDCLRNEVKQFGIDVIVIEPGGTKSEMIENGSADLIRVSGKTIYKDLANAVVKSYAAQKEKAIEAVEIAKLITKGIESKSPKTRYIASNAKPFLFIRKLLSDKLFDKLVMSQMK